MKNIYNITKSQLIACWFFGLIIFIAIMNTRDSIKNTFAPNADKEITALTLLVIAFGTVFILGFYSLGWINHKKNNR